MANILNRYTPCPNCGCKWDGGDIKEGLKALDVFTLKDDSSMNVIANESYGWTSENKARFSLVKNIIDNAHNIEAIECPKCLNVWNDNVKYPSLMHLYKSLEAMVEEPVDDQMDIALMVDELDEKDREEEARGIEPETIKLAPAVPAVPEWEWENDEDEEDDEDDFNAFFEDPDEDNDDDEPPF